MKKGYFVLIAGIIGVLVFVAGCTKNTPPSIDNLTADTLVTQSAHVTITCEASDQDEDDVLTYSWEAEAGTFEEPADSSVVVWIAPDSAGSYKITCTVVDKDGATAAASYTITVVPDYSPKAIGYKWYYRDEFVNPMEQDDTLFLETEVVDSGGLEQGGMYWAVERRLSTAVLPMNRAPDTLIYNVIGDSIWVDDPALGDDYLGLLLPLWAGKTWGTGEGGTGTVESSADTTVPQGAFNDCFHVVITGGSADKDFWVAPDVGMIITTFTVSLEEQEMNFVMELYDYDF